MRFEPAIDATITKKVHPVTSQFIKENTKKLVYSDKALMLRRSIQFNSFKNNNLGKFDKLWNPYEINSFSKCCTVKLWVTRYRY